VIVTKSTNACFSDMVRSPASSWPGREAQIGVDQEGSKVTDLFVREGDMVTDNQELARLTAPPQQPGAPAGAGPDRSRCARRAPASFTEVRTAVGAPASPQAGPMFRISVNNEIELDAEVRASILLKLNPGATVPDQPRRTRPIWSARSGRSRRRSTAHPARSCPDIANQQSLAEGRHVCPCNIDAKRQLRRRPFPAPPSIA